MYARIGDIGDIMMVTFLSVLGTTQTFSRNCALFGLCGKVGPPQSLASFEKQKLLLRGRLGAAPRLGHISRADTPKFRKHLNTWNVEKLRRNSLVLQFQKIPHQY